MCNVSPSIIFVIPFCLAASKFFIYPDKCLAEQTLVKAPGTPTTIIFCPLKSSVLFIFLIEFLSLIVEFDQCKNLQK